MKLLFPRLVVLILAAASLCAEAALKPSGLLGEAAQARSLERAIITAVADRTIVVTGATESVSVKHFEVVRFVSGGREFTWSFDGTAQPGPFDLMQIAPAGFVDHSVKVYVSLTGGDFPG
jgi:heavy-metal resistance protein CzcE